jgi:hypothetical protein
MPKSYDLQAGIYLFANGDPNRPAFVDLARAGRESIRIVLDAGERKTATISSATDAVASDVVVISEDGLR